MEHKQIVYLVNKIMNGDLIYDKNGVIIGYWTGYSTKPGVNSNGHVEINNKAGESYWVEGEAFFQVGFGLKFVADYIIYNNK